MVASCIKSTRDIENNQMMSCDVTTKWILNSEIKRCWVAMVITVADEAK